MFSLPSGRPSAFSAPGTPTTTAAGTSLNTNPQVVRPVIPSSTMLRRHSKTHLPSSLGTMVVAGSKVATSANANTISMATPTGVVPSSANLSNSTNGFVNSNGRAMMSPSSAQNRVPPLNVQIPPASGRPDTPDEFSPLPSPLMSPTVIRAAQALAVLPEAARMSPLRSPLAALYGTASQQAGRSPLWLNETLEAEDSEDDVLTRSGGVWPRSALLSSSRRNSLTRHSIDEVPCRHVRV